MKKILNPQTTLFAVGVMQPATAREIGRFLWEAFAEGGDRPAIRELENFLDEQIVLGRVLEFEWEKRRLFSLTRHGNLYMRQDLRKLRDKLRLYLLKKASAAKKYRSRAGGESGLAGVSPAVDTSRALEGGAAKNSFGLRALGQRSFWPRLGEQLSETGPVEPARDLFPPLLSFATHEQAAAALGTGEVWDLDLIGFALSLGISPMLVSQIIYRPGRHYRTFQLPKKGGGIRTIEAPRVFLKVLQRVAADLYLRDLRVSEVVHSFRSGRSVITNAEHHVGARYVANVDITDFFGRIKREQIKGTLVDNGFSIPASEFLSRLVTKKGRLPQGAPTSPLISNAVLYSFDERVAAHCAASGLIYSRYADDMTVSGNDRRTVNGALGFIRSELRKYGLSLNNKKTRVATRSGQQRVTGVVVNVVASPPRTRRKLIRAIFDHARKRPEAFSLRLSELGGYIGYLQQFPKLRISREVDEYRKIIRRVSAHARGANGVVS